MASARATFTWLDHSNETATVSLEGDILTAGDFAIQSTQWSDLRAAIGGVVLGTPIKSDVGNVIKFARVVPVNAAAQRENKWLVTYEDDGAPGRLLQCELPCANLTANLFLGETDLADLSDAAWVTFVTAFEGVVKAPYTGGDVTVKRVQFVGRRL